MAQAALAPPMCDAHQHQDGRLRRGRPRQSVGSRACSSPPPASFGSSKRVHGLNRPASSGCVLASDSLQAMCPCCHQLQSTRVRPQKVASPADLAPYSRFGQSFVLPMSVKCVQHKQAGPTAQTFLTLLPHCDPKPRRVRDLRSFANSSTSASYSLRSSFRQFHEHSLPSSLERTTPPSREGNLIGLRYCFRDFRYQVTPELRSQRFTFKGLAASKNCFRPLSLRIHI
jgi:hypothetical protein